MSANGANSVNIAVAQAASARKPMIAAGATPFSLVPANADAEPLQNHARRCPWPACSANLDLGNGDFDNVHVNVHWTDTLYLWSGARKCDLLNCPSNATFKSPSHLKTHILNIHINPLVCTHSGCSYIKPFGKQYELARHVSTAHGDVRIHKCPVESCEANLAGFARKDKLLKHLREEHDNLKCPYNHCSATVHESQQKSHLDQSHGVFECALGACANGRKSLFSAVGLKRHIRKIHNGTGNQAWVMMCDVRQTLDKTAREFSTIGRQKWKDCTNCSKQQSS